jgi:hypothetical protein
MPDLDTDEDPDRATDNAGVPQRQRARYARAYGAELEAISSYLARQEKDAPPVGDAQEVERVTFVA